VCEAACAESPTLRPLQSQLQGQQPINEATGDSDQSSQFGTDSLPSCTHSMDSLSALSETSSQSVARVPSTFAWFDPITRNFHIIESTQAFDLTFGPLHDHIGLLDLAPTSSSKAEFTMVVQKATQNIKQASNMLRAAFKTRLNLDLNLQTSTQQVAAYNWRARCTVSFFCVDAGFLQEEEAAPEGANKRSFEISGGCSHKVDDNRLLACLTIKGLAIVKASTAATDTNMHDGLLREKSVAREAGGRASRSSSSSSRLAGFTPQLVRSADVDDNSRRMQL